MTTSSPLPTATSAASPPPAGKKPAAASARRITRGISWPAIVVFLLPAIALYLAFVVYPIIQSTRYSLYDWNGLEPLTDFVGLDNFRRAFSDDLFRDALRHNGVIIALSLLLQIPFALGLALLLNVKLPGRALLRTMFFAPYILSEVVTAVVWRQILRPDGLLDQSLTAIGAEGLIHEWLGNPDIVLYSLFFVISWKYFGFHMILILAGLQQIPKELNEAALIDGASPWQRFRLRDAPAARPDDPRVRVPVDHWRPPVVRPRVGHHQGRTDRGVVNDGDVPLRAVPAGVCSATQVPFRSSSSDCVWALPSPTSAS